MVTFTMQVSGDKFVITALGAAAQNPTVSEVRALLESFTDGSAKSNAKIALKKLCVEHGLNVVELLGEG